MPCQAARGHAAPAAPQVQSLNGHAADLTGQEKGGGKEKEGPRNFLGPSFSCGGQENGQARNGGSKEKQGWIGGKGRDFISKMRVSDSNAPLSPVCATK